MSFNKIGIIGAMEVEISILLQKMKEESEITQKTVGVLVFYSGKLFGKSIVLVKSGVGKVNAALCAQQLILQFGADCIINTGIAGAIGHDLKVFDMVASTKALYHDMDASVFGYKLSEIPQMNVSCFDADKTLLAKTQKAFSLLPYSKKNKMIAGIVATGDQFVADRNKKNFILQNFDAACVEMEGAGIAHACHLNSTPYLILRCISDMADENYEGTYTFNEKIAAEESADVLLKILEEM